MIRGQANFGSCRVMRVLRRGGSDSTALVASVRGRLLLLIRRRILDAIQHLADSLVGHCLEDSNFGLLPGGQQGICVCQKFLLVRQAVRICLVQFLDHSFNVVVGAAAIDELADLVQRSRTAGADLKPVTDKLTEERKNLREDFIVYFSYLLELTDIKAKNHVLQCCVGSGPLWILSWSIRWTELLPRPHLRVGGAGE